LPYEFLVSRTALGSFQTGFVLLDIPAELSPPAPVPRAEALGPLSLLRVLANNPLEAWTSAHFEQPVVMGGLSVGRVAVISDPGAIRRVLMVNVDNYQKDWLQRRVLSAALANGLLAAEADQWKLQRRALAPLFNLRTVLGFTTAMLEAADAAVERLSQREGQVVDVADEATRITADVLERTVFSDGLGRNPDDVRAAMTAYFDTVGRIDPLDILGVPSIVPRPSRWKLRPTLKFFEETIDEIIALRQRRLAADPTNVPRDILTLLLEARDPDSGKALSDVEVRANILTFIAAGQETTANCITWTMYLLSQSREWRERVQAEAEGEWGSLESLADRLVVTRAVIDETNRLYPPITAISRTARGYDELAGETIKPGTLIVIAPYVLHRHRALWTRPNAFDPNRFFGKARESMDRFAYLPFGVGPRTCIGATFAIQEASIMVATIMRHFTLEMVPGNTPWPVQKVTLRPRGGLPMIVRRR
jgi:cytochrome P450